MNPQPITSDLVLERFCVREVSVRNENGSILPGMKQMIRLDIRQSEREVDGDRQMQSLLLTIHVIVSNDEDEATDEFKLTIEGEFSAKSELEEKEFRELVQFNGSSVLFSLARAKVEEVSALTYEVGKIILPLVNMIQFFRNQDQEQIVEQPE
nr:MAG TPA: Protein-export protein secB, Greek key beta sheet.35A [Caudoviricetes sp.]